MPYSRKPSTPYHNVLRRRGWTGSGQRKLKVPGAPDGFRVFYMKAFVDMPKKDHPLMIAYTTGSETPHRLKELKRYYREVWASGPEWAPHGLGEIWNSFNDDQVNPLATDQGQRSIRQKHVGHTSMSVGDVIVWKGEAWAVAGMGFTKLPFKVP